METRPYRTVGYRRVSSREQLDGHNLEAQEVHISNFVEAQGWSLVQIYTDAGISAKKVSRRPALEQLLRDAKDGLFDVVVVDKIDRFYRHLGGLLTTLEQLHSSGVSFASVQEKLDFTTPWGKLMLNQTTLQLNDGSEVPLRQKGRKGYTPPGPFGRDTIRDMIHRLAYTGKLPYQGMDEAGHHRKRCPPKEVFEGNHPALIDQELFDQVQNVRSLGFRNPKQKNGKTCRVFPLTGILRCGYCGGRMRGESSYNRRVYGDGRRIERKVLCQQKQIGADILEQQAIEFLRDVVEHSNGKEELNVLQKQIKAAEDRLERARELYLAGEINRLNYNEERSRLESLEKDLHYNTIGATMTSLGVIRSGIAEWNDLSQIEQKRLLRLAVEAAWVRENAVVAVQPSIAFLSLLSGENGNMGSIEIRTRG